MSGRGGDIERWLEPVHAWLATLEAHVPGLRYAPGGRAQELGDYVVFGQLRERATADMVRQAVEGMSSFAEACIDDPAYVRPFAESVIVAEPRACDLALLIHGASLLLADLVPREQGLYAAVLLDVLVRDVRASEQPAVRLIQALLSSRAGELVDAARRAAAAIVPGYGRALGWPSAEAARALRDAVAALHEPWERVARALHRAVAPPVRDLSMEAVAKAVAETLGDHGRPVEPGLPELVASINRPTQTECAETRLRAAVGWPARAVGILDNLSLADGWLRLHLAYLERVVSWVHQRAGMPLQNDVEALLSNGRELVVHEIVYPIARGIDSFAGQIVHLYSVKEPRYLGCDDNPERRRKRLERQRRACMGGALDPVDPDHIELLREIGVLYFSR